MPEIHLKLKDMEDIKKQNKELKERILATQKAIDETQRVIENKIAEELCKKKDFKRMANNIAYVMGLDLDRTILWTH